MEQKMRTKASADVRTKMASPRMFKTILEELRLLRNEVALLFPQDDLDDYADPHRIKRSYQKAVRKYPPVSSV